MPDSPYFGSLSAMRSKAVSISSRPVRKTKTSPGGCFGKERQLEVSTSDADKL